MSNTVTEHVADVDGSTLPRLHALHMRAPFFSATGRVVVTFPTFTRSTPISMMLASLIALQFRLCTHPLLPDDVRTCRSVKSLLFLVFVTTSLGGAPNTKDVSVLEPRGYQGGIKYWILTPCQLPPTCDETNRTAGLRGWWSRRRLPMHRVTACAHFHSEGRNYRQCFLLLFFVKSDARTLVARACLGGAAVSGRRPKKFPTASPSGASRRLAPSLWPFPRPCSVVPRPVCAPRRRSGS